MDTETNSPRERTASASKMSSFWPWVSAANASFVVHKFGGTSCANASCYQKVQEILSQTLEKDHASVSQDVQQAVVVSAMGGVTDALLEVIRLAEAGRGEYRARFDAVVQRHRDTVAELAGGAASTTTAGAEFLSHLQRDADNVGDLLRAVYLSKCAPDFYRDLIVGHGELWSAQMLSAALCESGRRAGWLDARQVLVVHDEKNCSESPPVEWDRSKAKFNEWFQYKGKEHDVIVITGFIASTLQGVPTTLKRNGSDYSASIFGNLLSAKRITIWTDVDGVYSADPRCVPAAYLLPHLSYTEAIEFSFYGARVLHPKTMAPAMRKGIPIFIRNTFKPSCPGTRIHSRVPPAAATTSGASSGVNSARGSYNALADGGGGGDDKVGGVGAAVAPAAPDAAITGLCLMDKLSLVNVRNVHVEGGEEYVPLHIRTKLLASLRNVNISMVTVAQSAPEQSVCFCVPDEAAEVAKATIEEHFSSEGGMASKPDVELLRGFSIVTAVGDTVNQIPGVAAKFFGALGRMSVNALGIAQNGERIISVLVESSGARRAVRALHTEFLMPPRRINLCVIGAGLVGGELLDQLAGWQRRRAEREAAGGPPAAPGEVDVDLRVACVMNSRRMAVQRKRESLALSGAEWNALLQDETSSRPADVKEAMGTLTNGTAAYSVVIDCTSNDAIAAQYPAWLRAGVHVVTPNKKAFSGDLALWDRLQALTAPGHLHLFHETTVGAGLPIISTLHTLLDTGDRLTNLEGVFSGTLSFILNTFCAQPDKRFSEVVREAQQLGYTEPNPKDDMEGTDVARKVCILARVAGLRISLADIPVQSLVPEALRGIAQGPQFLDALQAHDAHFDALRKEAAAQNSVLRFVGTCDEQGNAKAEMRSYPTSHPFGSLQGADNCVAFTTARYPLGLVIQGAGAGAAVTAAGVMGDVVELSRRIIRPPPGPATPAVFEL